jgi:hypothetical protein
LRLSASLASVPTREELEQLSPAELHDRATKLAKHRMDVRFFWRLMEALPAAEASSGQVLEAETDVQSIYGHLNDLRKAGEGDIADALRPMYIEYLEKHERG